MNKKEKMHNLIVAIATLEDITKKFKRDLEELEREIEFDKNNSPILFYPKYNFFKELKFKIIKLIKNR